MKKKIQGLWEEENMNEAYSANVFYNNTFEIAEVRERQSGKSLGLSFTCYYRIWGGTLILSPLLDVTFSFGGNFPITRYLFPLEHHGS